MRKLLSIVFLMSFASVAKAGYLAEPYLGVQGGTTKFEQVGAASFTQSYDLGFIGSKLGWRFGMIALYVNPRFSFGNSKDTTTQASWKVTNTDLFADVAFHFGPMWSLFFGLSPATSQTLKSDNTELKLTGTNMHFGFGYKDKGWNYNLELTSRKYTKQSLNGGAETEFSTSYSSMTDMQFAFSAGYTFGSDK